LGDTVAAAPAPQPPAVPEPEVEAFSDPLPRPEMRKINAPSRLQDRLVKLDCQGRPLIDFLRVLSDYSTVPITLDPVALTWSRITPDQPLNQVFHDVTVLEALQQALRPFRLEPVLRDHQIYVTRPVTPRTIVYPCNDLATKPEDFATLEGYVRTLAHPEVWREKANTIQRVGEGLSIQTSETVHMHVLELFERLRVARNLPIRSKFPSQMFPLATRTERSGGALDQPLTLNFAQPTAFSRVARQLHAETGLHVLVDWSALAAEGWPDDTETKVVWEKVPLGTALIRWLRPMDLDFRIVDEHVLQITSRRIVMESREFELYRVGDLLASDEVSSALVQRVRDVLGERVALECDVPSRTLLVLASQPDQQKLAALLASWRGDR
jgi:hypothetical protein